MSDSVEITVDSIRLELRHIFRIARGSSSSRTNAVVHLLGCDGEAALAPYYPTTLEDIREYVATLDLNIPDVGLLPLTALLDSLPPGPAPARAALDMALHDLWARRIGAPLYSLFGLTPKEMPACSYALPIPESIEALDMGLADFLEWPLLKLKLGSGDTEFDLAIVRRTRQLFQNRLCIDVNGGWAFDEAIRLIPAMTEFDLEFIEEPVDTSDTDDWHLLRRLLPSEVPPLMADESIQTADDILALAGAADGVNLKLAKCGGIGPVRVLISLARSLDLTVMIGCMIESSLALTAAAHLGGLADYLDLDGSLHVANDPFEGMTLNNGAIHLPPGPGLGVTRIHQPSS